MNTLASAIAKTLQLVVAVALVATPAAMASAAEAPSDAAAAADAPAVHYRLVDERGNVVGELITDGSTRAHLRSIGNAVALRAPQNRAVVPVDDRTFHPDFSKALTTGQMTAAWQAELDRLFPPPAIGGG